MNKDTKLNIFVSWKPMELTVDMDILLPTYLPSGEINQNRELGKLVVTER